MLAIDARNLSKVYKLYANPKDRLKEALFRGRTLYHREFWALQRVSFEVKAGSSVGIIGENGAGKSTLLQVVAGVIRPTSGQITTSGRISAILELGAGFNPEFTGRENVMLTGVIMGLTRREMEKRFDEIAAFAEIGDFIDRPVKIYSSGMYVRLAFAVATSIDPDVLIVDEALSVGDQYFQKRCIDRIERFRQAGKTIVFCSHSLYQVRMVCAEAIWLKDGQIARAGEVEPVVAAYENYVRERESPQASSAQVIERSSEVFPWLSRVWVGRAGTDLPSDQFVTGEELTVSVEYTVPRPPIPVHVGICIDRNDGVQAFGIGTHVSNVTPSPAGGRVRLRLPRLPLLSGQYTITVYLLDEYGLHVYDRLVHHCPFQIAQNVQAVGLTYLPHRWEVEADPRLGEVPAFTALKASV